MVKDTAHAEDWDFYFSNVDDIISSFFIDLGLKKAAPMADLPYAAWVAVFMQNPMENGLSNKDECDTLYDIEDRVVGDVIRNHNAVYAGRLTSNGYRQLFFYLDDARGYEKTIIRSMSRHPEYKYDLGSKEDIRWETYLDFLYPLPDQYQMIMNNRVVRALEGQGDELTRERMVDHLVYFVSESDMKDYISEVEKLDFRVISSRRDEEHDVFVLNIGRMDKADYDSVNDYVLRLCELAGRYNGDYDGWGCQVEKD